MMQYLMFMSEYKMSIATMFTFSVFLSNNSCMFLSGFLHFNLNHELVIKMSVFIKVQTSYKMQIVLRDVYDVHIGKTCMIMYKLGFVSQDLLCCL